MEDIKKIMVIIPTYNRESMLLELLRNIKRESGAYDITVFIYDDNSEETYNRVIEFGIKNLKFKYVKFDYNHGKRKFWLLHRKMFEDIKPYPFDYIIQLPDDCLLVPDFFKKAVNYLTQAPIDALNIFTVQSHKRMYETQPYNKQIIKGVGYWCNGWLDCCFVAYRSFMDAIDYTMPEIPETRWAINPNCGSAVGVTLSNWAKGKGQRILHLEKSLVIHKGFESQMNPVYRKKDPCYSVL